MQDESDEDLMLRYQRGEVRAFELLLARHRKPVFNFILRFVGDKTQAEDLLQDTFLRIVRGTDSYQRQAKLTTWMYTIARNLCVDASRRARFRRGPSVDAPLDRGRDGPGGATLLDVVPAGGLPADRRAISAELGGRIQAAVETLSEEQREVFVMREMLDLPFKEIAEIVGAPENTVKSRMRYALEKLREQLAEYRDLAQAPPVEAVVRGR